MGRVDCRGQWDASFDSTLSAVDERTQAPTTAAIPGDLRFAPSHLDLARGVPPHTNRVFFTNQLLGPRFFGRGSKSASKWTIAGGFDEDKRRRCIYGSWRYLIQSPRRCAC